MAITAETKRIDALRPIKRSKRRGHFCNGPGGTFVPEIGMEPRVTSFCFN
jgi:hypothetical protein